MPRLAAPPWRLLLTGALAFASAAGAQAEEEKKDYSAAERAIFMSDQLHNVKAPASLRYSFKKSGALEEGFSDSVSISLTPQPDGSCCAAKGDFLSGTHQLQLPDIENATGNPVTIFFLEYDVREMQRLTKGQQAHFRRRIRMAIYDGATIKEVSLPYKGASVKGEQIDITPYVDDPARPRFEKFARKRYTFLLSPDVPGGVYGIRSNVVGADSPDAAPLITEELLIEGADSPKENKTP